MQNKKRCRHRVPTWFAAVRPVAERLSQAPTVGYAVCSRRTQVNAYARYATIYWRFWRWMTLTFDFFNWKLAHHLLVPWGHYCTLFCFLFRVTSQYGTDGQTDERARRVMWPIERPNKNENVDTQTILSYTVMQTDGYGIVPFIDFVSEPLNRPSAPTS